MFQPSKCYCQNRCETEIEKTRENRVLLAIFTPPTNPLVHIVLLKEIKYSIEVFQCLIYYYYGYDMTNTGDESNDRKDHDGNAACSTSDASQVKIQKCTKHITFVLLSTIIKLYLTKIQHYVTIGYDKILDPIYYEYQCIFLHSTYLASLLLNENVTRPQSRTKEVVKQYCVLYRKGRHGEKVAKELLASFMFVYKYFRKNTSIYTCKIIHCKIYVLYNTDAMSDLTFYLGIFTQWHFVLFCLVPLIFGGFCSSILMENLN